MDMIEIIETGEVLTKTITAEADGFNVKATINIEGGRIVNISGSATSEENTVFFDGQTDDSGQLVENYRRITAETRPAKDVISAVIDAAKFKYQQ